MTLRSNCLLLSSRCSFTRLRVGRVRASKQRYEHVSCQCGSQWHDTVQIWTVSRIAVRSVASELFCCCCCCCCCYRCYCHCVQLVLLRVTNRILRTRSWRSCTIRMCISAELSAFVHRWRGVAPPTGSEGVRGGAQRPRAARAGVTSPSSRSRDPFVANP